MQGLPVVASPACPTVSGCSLAIPVLCVLLGLHLGLCLVHLRVVSLRCPLGEGASVCASVQVCWCVCVLVCECVCGGGKGVWVGELVGIEGHCGESPLSTHTPSPLLVLSFY